MPTRLAWAIPARARSPFWLGYMCPPLLAPSFHWLFAVALRPSTNDMDEPPSPELSRDSATSFLSHSSMFLPWPQLCLRCSWVLGRGPFSAHPRAGQTWNMLKQRQKRQHSQIQKHIALSLDICLIGLGRAQMPFVAALCRWRIHYLRPRPTTKSLKWPRRLPLKGTWKD
jgi:hypothetical protein